MDNNELSSIFEVYNALAYIKIKNKLIYENKELDNSYYIIAIIII